MLRESLRDSRAGRKSANSRGMPQPSRQERERQREVRRGNRQILLVTYCITIIFLCMAGFLVYFMAVQSREIINNPYNKRQEVLAKKVSKGKILSADGKVLAETKTGADGKDTRVYPYKDMFCHIVGRAVNSMTGIEEIGRASCRERV